MATTSNTAVIEESNADEADAVDDEHESGPVLPARVAKVGNITRTPELGYGQGSGKAYARFGIAVNKPKVKGDWAGEQVTEFYEVSCFGSLAEHVAESLRKGQRVVVVGRGELEHWSGDDGTGRTTKKIVAEAVGPDLRFTAAIASAPTRTAAGSADADTLDAGF